MYNELKKFPKKKKERKVNGRLKDTDDTYHKGKNSQTMKEDNWPSGLQHRMMSGKQKF